MIVSLLPSLHQLVCFFQLILHVSFFHFNSPFLLSYQFPTDMRRFAKYNNEIEVFFRCDVDRANCYKKINRFFLTSVCFALQRYYDDRYKRLYSLPRMNQMSTSDRCIAYYHVNSSTIKYLFCILDFKGFSAIP